jgi:hypothetical protein
MKYINKIIAITALLLTNVMFAEQESTPKVPPSNEQEESTPKVTPIKEIKVDGLNFEEVSKESKIGCLAEYVKDKSISLESFLQAIKLHKTHLMLSPYAEGLAYVNGQLCHVGNYPQSIIYTVLEGPHYGLQTTTAYSGLILYVNYDYSGEYTPYGVVLHHYYSDSEVITGANQVVSFY